MIKGNRLRDLAHIAIALTIYAAAFTAFRMGGMLGASAVFDWLLVAAAAGLAVWLARPVAGAQAALIFAVTGVLAFLLGVLISYTVLGDSF